MSNAGGCCEHSHAGVCVHVCECPGICLPRAITHSHKIIFANAALPFPSPTECFFTILCSLGSKTAALVTHVRVRRKHSRTWEVLAAGGTTPRGLDLHGSPSCSQEGWMEDGSMEGAPASHSHLHSPAEAPPCHPIHWLLPAPPEQHGKE